MLAARDLAGLARFAHERHAAAAGAVIALAALHGWIAHGWNDWAMINKAAGFAMLLVLRGDRRADRDARAAPRLVHAAADVRRRWRRASCARSRRHAPGPQRMDRASLHFVSFQISGFSQNPNAFALHSAAGARRLLTLRLPLRMHSALISILVAGIWFSGSRSGADHHAHTHRRGVCACARMSGRFSPAAASAFFLLAAIAHLPLADPASRSRSSIRRSTMTPSRASSSSWRAAPTASHDGASGDGPAGLRDVRCRIRCSARGSALTSANRSARPARR